MGAAEELALTSTCLILEFNAFLKNEFSCGAIRMLAQRRGWKTLGNVLCIMLVRCFFFPLLSSAADFQNNSAPF